MQDDGCGGENHQCHKVVVGEMHRHCKQKKRQHHEYHDKCRRTCSDMRFEQKEKRYTDQRTAAEADKLPLCEVEQEFGFDMS